MCNCKISCPFLAIVVSIIVGIITAFLRITAVITISDAFLWVSLGIAVVYLAIALISTTRIQCPNIRSCICPILSALIIGIIGAILVSLVLLAIEFAATSIIGAIIAGALIAFLFLIFTSTACLIKCIAKCES